MVSMDYAAALIDQNRMLGELTRSADPTTPVPTCPDWTLRDLVTHVGRGDRWAATIVSERSDGPVDIRTVADGKPPPEPAAAIEWLGRSAQQLVDAVAAAGAEERVWTFTGPKPPPWWVRRRLHEATVHRADAAIALGIPYELAPELAADGISEHLDLLAARTEGPSPLEEGTSLHLHATDDGLGEAGEWVVTATDPGVAWEHGHTKATVAVRGSAADLLLVILRRIPMGDERIQVLGDEDMLPTWLERTAF